MKKKILLSVFSVFSLMIASKSFAQSYHTTYIKADDHHYDDRGKGMEIRRDEEKVNYTLQLIEQKQAELQRDRAYGNRFAYREDKHQLRQLTADLSFYQNKLEADRHEAYRDRREHSSRRF